MKASGKAILPALAVVAVTALGLSQSDNITNTSSQNIIIQNVIQSETVSTSTENLIENIVEDNVENVIENTVVNKTNNTAVETSTDKSEVKNTVEHKTDKEDNKVMEQPIVETTPVKNTNSDEEENTSNQSVPNTTSSATSTTTTIPTSATYILNTNSKKFHKPSCASVKKMKESNKETFTGSRDDVISRGYQPCKNCNP